jgi:hypothetical protein
MKRRYEKHGLSGTRLYRIYYGMLSRCGNPNHDKYHYYGGRGITVHEEWRRSFSKFHEWAHANGYSEKLTIERVNPDGSYEPDNCTFIPRRKQPRSRRHTIPYTAFGESKLIADWAIDPRCPVSDTQLFARIKKGMSMQEAMTTPPRKNGKRDGSPYARPVRSRREEQGLVLDEVLLIRRRLSEGKTGKAIAREIGVSEATISNVKNGVSWKHV